MHRKLIVFLALLLVPPALAAQTSLAIVNAKIFTNDPKKPWAEAMAIDGERIVAIGSNAEVRAKVPNGAVMIDGGGRTIIPGINDAHTHPGADIGGFGVLTGPTSTWLEMAAALANAADETPAGTWIVATAGPAVMLDPNVDAAALDRAAPKRAVIVKSFTGHGIILSSAAMKLLGVEGKGRVAEYPQWRLQKKLLAMTTTRGDLVEAIRAYSADAARLGITSIQAMPFEEPSAFAAAWREAGATQRLRLIAFPLDERAPFKPQGTDGLKWILDGTPMEKGAAVGAEYPHGGGRGTMNFDALAPLVRAGLDANQQLLFHAVGDVTIAKLLDALEAARADWPALRPRIEHADGLFPAMTERAKRLGIVAVLNPTHFFARPFFPATAGYSRFKSLLDARIPVAIGSDGAPSPFVDIMLAVHRPDLPNEAVTVAQAVDAYTRGSAFAEKKEKEKGVLAPGYLADFAMLSHDIFTVPPPAIAETRSVMTVIGGKIVYRE